MNTWRAYLNKRDWQGSAELFVICDKGLITGPDGFKRVTPGLMLQPTFRQFDDGGAFSFADDPTLAGKLADVTGFLQAIMDIGWREGLRPNGWERHDRELAAVKDHLEDMRALAKIPARK
mgnify:FL=1